MWHLSRWTPSARLSQEIGRASLNVLQIERGAEQYTFTYPSAQGSDRPSCVVMVPPQGQPWEEAISRNTGVHPQKLDGGTGTVSLLQGTLPYTVDEKNVVVRVGACPAGG